LDLSSLIPRFELRPIGPDDIAEFYVERRAPRGSFEQLIENDLRQRKYSRTLIVGGRGSGKTSLNNYLFNHLMNKGDIIPVIVSRAAPPRTVHEVVADILNMIGHLFKMGSLTYAGGRDIDLLLKESRKTQLVLANLQEILRGTPAIKRLLVIVDELDKGHPRNASQILLGLEDSVSRIGDNIDLLATIAPMTLKRYLDTGLRATFHELDIPPLDKQRIIDVFEKRVNKASVNERVPCSDLIDADAMDLIYDLSLGMMRRAIDFIGRSLQCGVEHKSSKITRSLVEEALTTDVRSAQYFCSIANRREKSVIDAILRKDWTAAVEKHETLNELIDRVGYVIETPDESRPFIVSPELVRALKSTTSMRAITIPEVEEIRRTPDELHLGQDLEDANPFTLKLPDITRGIAILGCPGSGKTVLMKVIIEEVAMRGTNVIVFDTKGDLTDLAFPAGDLDRGELLHYGLTESDVGDFREKVKVKVFTPGSDLVNRLVLTPFVVQVSGRSGHEYYEAMSEALLALVDVDPRTRSRARTLVQVLLQHLSETRTNASISQLVDLLENPPESVRGISSKKMFRIDELARRKERARILQGLKALVAGTDRCLFEDGAGSFNLNDLMNIENGGTRIAIARLSHLSPRQQCVVIAWILQAFAFMMSSMEGNEKNPRVLLCLDEVWGILREAPAVTRGLERLIRLGRAFGLGCLIASQLQRDIPRPLLALIHTSFKPGSDQGRFELTKGSSKTLKFHTRWLLTRHGVHITEDDLLSLSETG